MKKKTKLLLQEGRAEALKSFQTKNTKIIIDWSIRNNLIIDYSLIPILEECFRLSLEDDEKNYADLFEALLLPIINAYVCDEQYLYVKKLILNGSLFILAVFIIVLIGSLFV